MIIFGALVFVPTSIPTWHMMPMKQSRTNGRPSSFRQATIPDALSGFSSSIGVAAKREIDSKLTIAYITNRALHPRPNVGSIVVAPQAAITGARNEAIA